MYTKTTTTEKACFCTSSRSRKKRALSATTFRSFQPLDELGFVGGAETGDRTGFAYLGVDVVLDKNKGPLLLEINARPGLSIQIANRSSLRPLLDTIDRELSQLKTIEDKISFAKDKFGK